MLQSAGVAQNKMLAKLGSAHKKPNGQTVIRNRAIRQFLSGFKFTKIRNLGGKLGDQIVQVFGTESVNELLLVSVDQLKLKLGDDTGVWVHNTIRGIDTSEVNSRVQIKSMLSAKSFRPTINSVDQGVKWLKIFVGDIFSRLVEEGVLENKRRPRTMNLHHRHGGQTRSRQTPIPQGKPIDKDMLLDLAKHLLNQIVLEGKVWPCANLSLSVGGFDEGVTGNMGISAFLVKGEEAQALKRSSREKSDDVAPERLPEKQRRTGKGPGIQHFFSKQVDRPGAEDSHRILHEPIRDSTLGRDLLPAGTGSHHLGDDNSLQEPMAKYTCSRCQADLDGAEDLQCHQDEHMAKDLQEEEKRGNRAFVGHSPAAPSTPFSNVGNRHNTAAAASKKTAKSRKKPTEAGQSKLKFG